MGFFLSFIPEKVKNRTVVNVLDRMRHLGRSMRIAWKYSAGHAQSRSMMIGDMLNTSHKASDTGDTKKEYTGSTPDAVRYIENQHNFGSIKYGRSDMAYAGCEVIAVYNALNAMGEQADLGELIAYFERDGMVLSGRFGTAPMAISDYFKKEGFRVEETLDPGRFDEIADHSEVSVIMFYNDRRSIMNKVHTVCITRETPEQTNTAVPAGYTAHNVYGNGVVIGPCDSVSALLAEINGGYSKGIVLFGISKPHS